MDPKGSSTHGKKNKREMKRWQAVAKAIYELMSIEDFPEVQPWDDAEEDDKLVAYQAADIVISLVDNLLVPAIRKGMK